MNNDGIQQIVIAIIIAILSSVIAYLKITMSKFVKKYGATIEQFEQKLAEDIGKEQYNKDVDVIKNALSEINVNKESITLEIADVIIKQVATKVKFNEHEILEIIMNIAKGVL